MIARQFAIANFDGEKILNKASNVDLKFFRYGIGSCVVVEEVKEILQGEICKKRASRFACNYDYIFEECVYLLLEYFALLRLFLLFSFLLSSLLFTAGCSESFLFDFDEILSEIMLGITAGKMATFLL